MVLAREGISAIILGLSAVLLTCIFRALIWVWIRPRKLEKHLKKLGFSGNSYKLFHGDMKEQSLMVREALSKPIGLSEDISHRVVPFLLQTQKKYGKRSFIWFGPTPRLYLMEPTFIKEVLNNPGIFRKVKSLPIGRALVTGIIRLEGEEWTQRRRLLNPAFHLEKLKQMLPAFRTSCKELVERWNSLAEKDECFEHDIWEDLLRLTGDVISRTAFGSNYEGGRKIFQLHREQVDVLYLIFQSPFYIPMWSYFPTKLNRRMKEIYREIKTILGGMIVRREEATRNGETVYDDLLGLLLESSTNEYEAGRTLKKEMNLDHVIDECKLFYFAGQETTTNLLAWTIVLLAIHQDWQTRAREEVLDVLGILEPDFDGINHLKVVTMILYEVLRLYPAVIEITRVVEKDINFGDLLLPAGVQVSLPIFFIQRDRDIWGNDANEFNPERFSSGVMKATGGKLAFLPFGYGPRICIGQNFALTEAKMAISMILQHFSLGLSSSYIHAPFNHLTLQPQFGAHIKFTRL